ncbi:MAG: GIY-YIG nuclease family protein [Candidatus Taylorbacteria bacterium]
MKRQYMSNLKLPDHPGIYIFRDYKKKPLYIGRATSLRDRVKSYFSNDLIKTRGPRLIDMVTKARSLSVEVTDSVLEAIILESILIKKFQPFYNVDEKDDKSAQYVVITAEEWPRVFLARARDFEQMKLNGELTYKVKEIFGPYPYGGIIKEALRILRRIFPFKDEKASDPRHDRFYRSIGRSPGMPDGSAAGHEEQHDQYARTIKYLTLFFRGQKRMLRVQIEKQMYKDIESLNFESAQESKRLLYALDHINDIALIKQEGQQYDASDVPFRMEAYDVAHLSGTNVVGGMVVSVDGEFERSSYRKFKISIQTNNDGAALTDMLLRRLNHTEWTYPDLIIVDGNEMQMTIAKSILRSRRLGIPVVAVTKNDQHRADRLSGDAKLIEKHSRSIISANAEAHRYTLAFHRGRRRL